MTHTDSLAPANAACMAYITVRTHEEAMTIAQALVSEHLAACVNILGPATSVYTWQGVMEEAQEFVMIAKTRQVLAAALSARVKTLHSYETPCIVTYAMDRAFPPFLAWINETTQAP